MRKKIVAYQKLELQIAMKLAPDRKKFMDVIGGSGDIKADIVKFCSEFPPFLEENHNFLVRSLYSLWYLLIIVNGTDLIFLRKK